RHYTAILRHWLLTTDDGLQTNPLLLVFPHSIVMECDFLRFDCRKVPGDEGCACWPPIRVFAFPHAHLGRSGFGRPACGKPSPGAELCASTVQTSQERGAPGHRCQDREVEQDAELAPQAKGKRPLAGGRGDLSQGCPMDSRRKRVLSERVGGLDPGSAR